MKLRISPRANSDVEAIWNYIARDNPRAADQVEDDIQSAMRMLAEFPGLGHTRPDVRRPGFRFWRVRSYLIVYRVDEDTLLVVRVIHGSREIRRQLRGES